MKFAKGKSGNPGGRPKALKEVAELAQRYAPDAIEALYANLEDENGSVRNVAAMAILDRGFGKPAQTVNSTVTTDVRRLSDEALAGALARVEAALAGGAEETERPALTH